MNYVENLCCGKGFDPYEKNFLSAAQEIALYLKVLEHDMNIIVNYLTFRTKIATSHGDHTIKISECSSCKVIHTLTGHIRTPWCVVFHPRHNCILASGCLGGQVRLWNLKVLSF